MKKSIFGSEHHLFLIKNCDKSWKLSETWDRQLIFSGRLGTIIPHIISEIKFKRLKHKFLELLTAFCSCRKRKHTKITIHSLHLLPWRGFFVYVEMRPQGKRAAFYRVNGMFLMVLWRKLHHCEGEQNCLSLNYYFIMITGSLFFSIYHYISETARGRKFQWGAMDSAFEWPLIEISLTIID